jgi:hypothetical protein
VPRMRNPLRRTGQPLAAGAPGHPLPPPPRASSALPPPALRGAPGTSYDSASAAGRVVADVESGGPAWELVALAVLLAAIGRIAEGPALWAGALLAGLALALASLEVLGSAEPEGVADLGIPVEALLLPAVVGIASVTALHVVPVGLLLVPGLVAVGALAAASVEVERRILARPAGATAEDRTALLSLVVVLAFVAFTGIAAAIPGALVEPLPAGAEAAPAGLPLAGLGLLAALDGLVAGILGYRLAALHGPTVRGALWVALSYAAVIAITAAALRAMGLPRLLGPALLTLVLYLWTAYRAGPRRAGRDARRIWEILLLAALGALVVAWNLLAQG